MQPSPKADTSRLLFTRLRVVPQTSSPARFAPSPIHALNRAVAEAYLHGPQAGLDRLAAVVPENVPTRYPGWHAVIGELHFRLGRHSAAEAAWREALRLTSASTDQEFLRRRLADCRRVLGLAADPNS